jgi:hypothetical protein
MHKLKENRLLALWQLGKCLFKVDSFNLSISFTYQSRFVPCNLYIFIQFIPENPFCADHILIFWSWNQFPSVIFLYLIQFFIHYDNVPLSLNHSLNQSMNPCSRPLSYIYPNLLNVLTHPSLSILSKTLLEQLSIMLTHLSLYYQTVLLRTDFSEYVF